MTRKIICDKCGLTDVNNTSLAPFPKNLRPRSYESTKETDIDLCDACLVGYDKLQAENKREARVKIEKWLLAND